MPNDCLRLPNQINALLAPFFVLFVTFSSDGATAPRRLSSVIWMVAKAQCLPFARAYPNTRPN